MKFKKGNSLNYSNDTIKFLKNEFGLSNQAIELAFKKSFEEKAPLAIILWSYGLISLSDYQTFLDWLDQNKF